MSNDLFTVAIEAISKGFDEANKKIDDLDKKVTSLSRSEGNAANSSDKLSKSKQRLTKSTREAGNAQQRARQHFLGMANSIAVLDGPLGGVASRFSAFGVLIGRIGIPLAGFAIALTSLSVAANAAIKAFTEYEVQLKTIENRLNSTGNQIALTADQVSRLSSQIGISTLASERDVLRAAGTLLTFGNVTTSVFEQVLRGAQDLAASGFGTIESETIRLAKALEDPRQGLTSLSRAGITFTRQQRNLIISLIDSGRQAEAYQLVMKNVERQVGGAGQAQANETLAGSFDTIGQAMRELSRNAGELIATEGAFSKFMANVARGARDLSELLSMGAEERATEKELRALEEQLQDVIGEITNLQSELSGLDDTHRMFAPLTAQLQGFRGIYREIAAEIIALQERQADLNQETREELALKEALNRIDSRERSIQSLYQQIDAQREFIGLTEEQVRINRILAEEGFGGNLGANMRREIAETTTAMSEAGRSADEIAAAVARIEKNFSDARDVAESLAKTMQDQRTARQIQQIGENTENTNALLRIQIALMKDGAKSTEAARMAAVQLERQQVLAAIATEKVAIAAAAIARNFDLALEAGGRLLNLMSTLSALDEREDLIGQHAALAGGPGSGGGGGGAGTDPNAEFQRELDQLDQYLEQRREQMMIAAGFERDLVMEQYDERFEVLQNALDRQLLSHEEYSDKLAQLTQSREDRITEIERAAHNARLSLTAGIFGNLSTMASAFGEKQAKTAAIFGGIQATISAYQAAAAAMAETPGDMFTRIAAYSSVLATGLGAVAAIRRAGGGGGGRGGGSASTRTASAPREAREATPQRVLIEGLDPNAMFSGEQLQNLFESFYSENQTRGNVFVVSQ